MDGRGGIGVEGGGRVGPHACTRISLYLSDLIFPLLESLCEADSCIQILCTHALDLLSPGGDSSLLVPDLHKIAMYADAQKSRHSQTAAPLLLLRAEMSADSVVRHFSSRSARLFCLLDTKALAYGVHCAQLPTRFGY